MNTSEIAKILANAAQLDLEIWIRDALIRLRESDNGRAMATWADANPAAFKNLLRGASAGIGQLPQNKNLLYDSIIKSMQHLPTELHYLLNSTDGYMSSNGESDEFRLRYEQALEGLTDEQLSQIARLNKSQIHEWVDSPKAIRPHLLSKWQEPTVIEQKVNSVYKEFTDYIERESEAIAQREAQMSPLRRWFRKLL